MYAKFCLILTLLCAAPFALAEIKVRPSIDEATANSAQWSGFKKTNFKVGNSRHSSLNRKLRAKTRHGYCALHGGGLLQMPTTNF